MPKENFVTVEVDGGELFGIAEVRLHPDVISVVDDEWRSTFYSLYTKEDIAEHIAYNLLRGYKLSQLDGWADMPDHYAKLV